MTAPVGASMGASMDVEFAVKSIYTRTGNSRSSVCFGVTSKRQYPCALEWQGDKLFLLMSQTSVQGWNRSRKFQDTKVQWR